MSTLRPLLKDSTIYGLGSIVPKVVSYLLVPYYAHVFSVAENGVLNVLLAGMTFAFIFFTHGMDDAYLRSVSLLGERDHRLAFSTAQLSLAGVAFGLSVLGFLFAAPLAAFIGAASETKLVRYAAIVLFLDALAVMPATVLRAEQKLQLFVLIKLTGVVVHIGLSIYFITVCKMGVEGLLLAMLIASAASLLCTWSVWRETFGFIFSAALWREMTRFAWPLVPAALAVIAIESLDRLLLSQLSVVDAERLYGRSAVEVAGIYANAYKLAAPVLLFVKAFQLAWVPFALRMSQTTERPKELFSRVMTLSVIAATTVAVGLSLFVQDAVRLLGILPPQYAVGLPVVPLVCLAYIFNMIFINLQAGAFIKKKSGALSVSTGSAAAMTLVLNIFLIPKFGMMGAAFTTAASYAAATIILLLMMRHIYPVHYAWSKILFCIAFAIAIVAACTLIEAHWIWRAIGMLFFSAVMLILPGRREIASLKTMFAKFSFGNAS